MTYRPANSGATFVTLTPAPAFSAGLPRATPMASANAEPIRSAIAFAVASTLVCSDSGRSTLVNVGLPNTCARLAGLSWSDAEPAAAAPAR